MHKVYLHMQIMMEILLNEVRTEHINVMTKEQWNNLLVHY